MASLNSKGIRGVILTWVGIAAFLALLVYLPVVAIALMAVTAVTMISVSAYQMFSE